MNCSITTPESLKIFMNHLIESIQLTQVLISTSLFQMISVGLQQSIISVVDGQFGNRFLD